MSHNLILLSGAAIATTGLFYLFRERPWTPETKHNLFGHEIHVVKCPKHCKWVLEKMMKENQASIGFNCQWNRGKPDLLMLADPHRICVIIRLQEMSSIPEALKDILMSNVIAKAGVETVEKANRLKTVNPCLLMNGMLDIRYLYSTKLDNLRSIVASELGVNLRDSLVPYYNQSASEAIACAKLLARYCESKQKFGPIELFFGEVYYSPMYVEQGYDIHYVTTAAHCKWIVSKLQEDISKEIRFSGRCIGLECTWYEDESGRRPVELLQIAGPSKICAVIRLSKMNFIPSELQGVLRDERIFKVGVSAIQGAKLLQKDYGLNVKKVMDLRHVYPRKPNGILALCWRILEKDIVSKWRKGKDRCHPPDLSHLQLKSSGIEAMAAINLFDLYFDRTLLLMSLGHNLEEAIEKGSHKVSSVDMYEEFVECTLPHTQHRIFNNDIHVVTSAKHCRWVVSKLREDIGNGFLIGFDFQDDLLQLASPNGICALIRLALIDDIPWELRELLENKSIAKYTFDGQRKARLEDSYFLQINCVRLPLFLSVQNLLDVVKRELSVDLGKTVCIRNEIELSDEEIQYCAGNVIAYAKMAKWPYKYKQFESATASTHNPCQYTTHSIFGHTIYIVNTFERCRLVTKKIREAIKDCPFVGFDCEWLPYYPRGPITLLQLAGGKGSQRLCALIRLCFDFEIPQELCDLLNDPTIVKAGVESVRDAQYLEEDYGLEVQGAIDLRFLYPQTSTLQANGLAALAKRELNVYLSKDKNITLSGFNQSILSYEQIQYAAGDAIVGANLYDKHWQKCHKSMSLIQPFLDKQYTICTKQRSQTAPHNHPPPPTPPRWLNSKCAGVPGNPCHEEP